MFNLFNRGRSKKGLKAPRSATGSIRDADLAELREWMRGRGFVEGFVEPETLVNEMSVVLVDEHGEFIRRRIGGPKGINDTASALGIGLFDVEETGYPQRMRERIERDRILRKRQEQRQRREEWEKRHPDQAGGVDKRP
ncbi:hypothetical protein CCICO_03525 [Corynebacterium ciconiae DSM 44920]|uniref:hypothetical protein n=1 Tax=Corynebacterium ciconiae TaxID=227319 RepID=UPI0003644EA1|nr:hypothetical protein [Corynebacterium ciconiae]WKD60744.1 hypothetical protein CCICO_03525 [Corynebacterium ciconiae DSM 44920]